MRSDQPKIHLDKIPRSFELPRPNWWVIESWIEDNVAREDREQAWWDAVSQWLDALNAGFGGGCRVARGRRVLVCTRCEETHEIGLAKFGEVVLDDIQKMLGDAVAIPQGKPIPVLVFQNTDDYYDYISHEYPEGDHGTSGGVCLRRGLIHVAIMCGKHGAGEVTLIHELTHVVLSHLRLPQWFEEGITQFMEYQLHPSRRWQVDTDLAAEKEAIAFWQKNPLSSFWWGESFSASDERQKHSYAFARLCLRHLASHRNCLPAFTRSAALDDAGESAAQEHLGVSLADVAKSILGPGDYSPAPYGASSFSQRGHFFFNRENYEAALADFTRACELVPDSADLQTNLGNTLWRLQRFEDARIANERAVELNPRSVAALNSLAWDLATCPRDEMRDGQRAIDLAMTACELSSYSDWGIIETLAAAFAESEDFDHARFWIENAIELAPDTEKAGCEKLQALFESETAYRYDGVILHRPYGAIVEASS